MVVTMVSVDCHVVTKKLTCCIVHVTNQLNDFGPDSIHNYHTSEH
jgi:hypothetical protein